MRKAVIVNGIEVGYILYNVYVNQEKTLYINSFTMYPLHRRKGYFKIMIAGARQIARSLGLPTMTLFVGSWEEKE